MGILMDKNETKHLQSFMSKANQNNFYSDKIVSNVLLFSNIWTTLVAPILIGIGISYIYGLSTNDSISWSIWLLIIIFALIHLSVSYLVHQNNSKFTLYSEAISLKTEYDKNMKEVRDELAKYKKAYRELSDLFSNQRTTLYILAHVVDNAIGNINRLEAEQCTLSIEEYDLLVNKDLGSMIRPFILEREALFGYTSPSLYNVALYSYDEKSDNLNVLIRDCDNRLRRRNRSWKPGHGHVGLAFLHKQIKICPDIILSNELAKDAGILGDNTRYRSFISIPILRCNDDGDVNNGEQPFGVLVLTSAIAEQFNENRDLQFLSTVAKVFAIYLAAAEAYQAHNKGNSNSSGDSDEKRK